MIIMNSSLHYTFVRLIWFHVWAIHAQSNMPYINAKYLKCFAQASHCRNQNDLVSNSRHPSAAGPGTTAAEGFAAHLDVQLCEVIAFEVGAVAASLLSQGLTGGVSLSLLPSRFNMFQPFELLVTI